MNKDIAKTLKDISVRYLIPVGIVIFSFMILYFLLNYLIMPFYTRQHQSIKVPEVTNLSFTAAQKILSKAGLKPIKAGEKYDESFPPGFVIFQNPEAEAPVKKGRRVYLTVSKGRRTFEMPKLVGLPLRDAKFKISDLHLILGNIIYENDTYYPEGVVSAQSIDPGKPIAAGEKIDLTVSLGVEPTEFIVPKVVGKSLNDAKLAIKKAGLTLGRIESQYTDKVLPNTVVGQSLEPGLEVSKGDTLDIVVSRLQEKKEDSLKW